MTAVVMLFHGLSQFGQALPAARLLGTLLSPVG